jgi:hypothetical protein
MLEKFHSRWIYTTDQETVDSLRLEMDMLPPPDRESLNDSLKKHIDVFLFGNNQDFKGFAEFIPEAKIKFLQQMPDRTIMTEDELFNNAYFWLKNIEGATAYFKYLEYVYGVNMPLGNFTLLKPPDFLTKTLDGDKLVQLLEFYNPDDLVDGYKKFVDCVYRHKGLHEALHGIASPSFGEGFEERGVVWYETTVGLVVDKEVIMWGDNNILYPQYKKLMNKFGDVNVHRVFFGSLTGPRLQRLVKEVQIRWEYDRQLFGHDMKMLASKAAISRNN